MKWKEGNVVAFCMWITRDVVYIKEKTRIVIFLLVNLSKNAEILNMTVIFCNFSRQKYKMTRMSTVDNYVETGDFFQKVPKRKKQRCQ